MTNIFLGGGGRVGGKGQGKRGGGGAAAAKELEEEGINGVRMRRRAGESSREDRDGMSPIEGRE